MTEADDDVPFGADIPVICAGRPHRLAWLDGHLQAPDHSAQEQLRELALAALGGPSPTCILALGIWRGEVEGRQIRHLFRLRQHALRAMHDGNHAELIRLVDLGIDPIGFRDSDGNGPLHCLALPGAPGIAPSDVLLLLTRMLRAGLDINARNDKGHPPLTSVVLAGGGRELVRAMLAVGADPLAVVTPTGHPRVLAMPDYARPGVFDLIAAAGRAAAAGLPPPEL